MKKTKALILFLCIVLLVAVLFVACKDKGEAPIEDDAIYTINYTDNGIKKIEVKYGELFSIETIPSKVGYTFKGLYDAEQGGTQYVGATGLALSTFVERKNMVLYAQFEPIEYTIVLNYGEASINDTQSITVKYAEKINTLPTGLTLDKKVFAGWFTEPDCNGSQIGNASGVIPHMAKVTETIFDISNPDGYIHLYAGFTTELIDVDIYVGDSKVAETIKVPYGSYMSDISTNAKVGDLGVLTWSEEKATSANRVAFTGKILSETTLYSFELAPYLEFINEGGKQLNMLIAKAGSKITLPIAEKTGCVFHGWMREDGSIASFSTMPSTSEKLTALWQPKISFNVNGGSAVLDITASSGSTINLPKPTKEGYYFAGWYDESNVQFKDLKMPVKSINLTARWYKAKQSTLLSTTSGEEYGGRTSNSFSTYDNVFILDTSPYVGEVVNVTITYSIRSPYASSSNQQTNKLIWYSGTSSSDAKNLWENNAELKDTARATFTETTEMKISSNNIYILRNVETYNGGLWSNVKVIIEYPDKSNLY